jgi:hypothetical protein
VQFDTEIFPDGPCVAISTLALEEITVEVVWW